MLLLLLPLMMLKKKLMLLLKLLLLKLHLKLLYKICRVPGFEPRHCDRRQVRNPRATLTP